MRGNILALPARIKFRQPWRRRPRHLPASAKDGTRRCRVSWHRQRPTASPLLQGKSAVQHMLMNIGVLSAAAAFFVLGASVKADELRVKDWPNGVPCSTLQHKSDGSWALADT